MNVPEPPDPTQPAGLDPDPGDGFRSEWSQVPILTLTRRGWVVVVVWAAGCWSYAVYDDAGRIRAGGRAWELSAAEARDRGRAVLDEHVPPE